MPLRASLASWLLLGLAACAGSSAEPAPPAVEVVGLEGIEAAIEARRGNACLVNFWATWCPPCVAELPELVAAAREFEPRGVRVLGVSFDGLTTGADRETTARTVRQFLESRALAFPTLVCDPPDFERTQAHFGLEGVIPVTLAYDARGALVDRHVGEGSRERFAAMMQKALGE